MRRSILCLLSLMGVSGWACTPRHEAWSQPARGGDPAPTGGVPTLVLLGTDGSADEVGFGEEPPGDPDGDSDRDGDGDAGEPAPGDAPAATPPPVPAIVPEPSFEDVARVDPRVTVARVASIRRTPERYADQRVVVRGQVLDALGDHLFTLQDVDAPGEVVAVLTSRNAMAEPVYDNDIVEMTALVREASAPGTSSLLALDAGAMPTVPPELSEQPILIASAVFVVGRD